MGKYIDAVCRLCRREGTQLFLKGDRCISPKCAVVKRKGPPGFRSRRRPPKISDYGLELREKQKIKRIYGLREKQFYNTFRKEEKREGRTADNLLIALEQRLDNVVYVSNLASSRYQARQLINHGHFLINGTRVNIPSYRVKEGDLIEAKEKSRNLSVIRDSLKNLSKRSVPSWINVDENKVQATVLVSPKREDIQIQANEQLVVEFYSKK